MHLARAKLGQQFLPAPMAVLEIGTDVPIPGQDVRGTETLEELGRI